MMAHNTFYSQAKPADAREIIQEHVVKGRKVTRLLYSDPEKNIPIVIRVTDRSIMMIKGRLKAASGLPDSDEQELNKKA